MADAPRQLEQPRGCRPEIVIRPHSLSRLASGARACQSRVPRAVAEAESHGGRDRRGLAAGRQFGGIIAPATVRILVTASRKRTPR
jgi:hypothetical protein